MLTESGMDIKASIGSYWHSRSDTYDKFPASKSEEEEKVAYRSVMQKCFKENGLRILDVGTGTGFIALMLAEMGHEPTGLDMAEGMIDKARRKASEYGYRVKFQLGDAENLPFANAFFDAVICRYLLWTLPNPWKALSEWIRVIKPDGKIVGIEGKWGDCSLKGVFKRLSRQLGILLYEKSNPRKLGYDSETTRKLPLCNGLTPEKAIRLFEGKGLGDISVEILNEVRDIQARNMPFLYRAALPPPTFLIKGNRKEK